VAALAEAPHPKSPEMRTLNRQQVGDFLNAVRRDRLEALYVLALATGMRRSELLDLKWEDLDLEARIVLVRRGLTISPNGGIEIDDPKRFDSKRRLEISSEVAAILKEHRKRQAEERRQPLAELGETRASSSLRTPAATSIPTPSTLPTSSPCARGRASPDPFS
jgi:integrase